MEKRDGDLLEQLVGTHPELTSLWEEHILFEKQIEKLESRPYRTPSEEVNLRMLKKQKLEGKTKMHDLLDQIAKEKSPQ